MDSYLCCPRQDLVLKHRHVNTIQINVKNLRKGVMVVIVMHVTLENVANHLVMTLGIVARENA